MHRLGKVWGYGGDGPTQGDRGADEARATQKADHVAGLHEVGQAHIGIGSQLAL